MLFKFVAITTVLTQFVLLTAMLGKGFITKKKVETIRAIYSGVDYEKIRKDTLLATITKERDPYQVSKTDLINTRKQAIDRQASQVSLSEIQLQTAGQRFAEVEVGFSNRVDNLESEIFSSTRRQLQRMFSNMSVRQKKDTLVDMISGGGIDDALFLVKGLGPSAQRKLFGEMKTEEEKLMIGTILKQVRNGSEENKQ